MHAHSRVMSNICQCFVQMLKVWDIKDYTCLQTIMIKFPTSLHGHIPEHGPFPLHLNAIIGSPHSCLLVVCNDYIGKLKLGLYQKPVDDIPRSHEAPLYGAIYNQFFREVTPAGRLNLIILNKYRVITGRVTTE